MSDYLEARSWTDANTVILYAHSERNGGEAAALFTLKFDEAGNWKNHQDASDVQERDRCSE